MSGKVHVKDGVWKKLKQRMAGFDKAHVKVGILASQGGNEVPEGSELSLIDIGSVHEFGSEAANIPERSWLRRTFEVKTDALKELQGKLYEKVTTGKMDAENALELLGQWAAAETKKTITHGEHIPPPLAASTVARKGSDRPLVDTGQLVDAITYEVVK